MKIATSGFKSIAWRVIASANTYFWRATWGSLGFRLLINDGGVSGRNVYDFSRDLLGVYDPNPHFVYLGSPPNRGGPDAQTVPGIVIRQVWVSSRPRPAFANQ